MPKPDNVGVGVSAILCAFDSAIGQSRVLIGKRLGNHFNGVWAVPGGWIDVPDNTVGEAALREAQEEVDADLYIGPKVIHTRCCIDKYEDKAVVTINMIFNSNFFIEGTKKLVVPSKELDKFAEWRWMSRSDIRELRLEGEQFFPNLLDIIEDWL